MLGAEVHLETICDKANVLNSSLRCEGRKHAWSMDVAGRWSKAGPGTKQKM